MCIRDSYYTPREDATGTLRILGSLTHQHHPAMPAAGEVRKAVFCALVVAVLSSAGPDAPPVTTARKIGVRRELSTVDLNQDLAVPADLRSPPVKSQPVFRANSFVSADPRSGTDEPGLRTQHGAPGGPKRGNSMSLAPPRRETSQADLSQLSSLSLIHI